MSKCKFKEKCRRYGCCPACQNPREFECINFKPKPEKKKVNFFGVAPDKVKQVRDERGLGMREAKKVVKKELLLAKIETCKDEDLKMILLEIVKML